VKFTTLSGHTVAQSISSKEPGNFRSGFEAEVYEKLVYKFPYDIILYEWHVPGNNRLSLDFFLPHRSLALECDGSHHHTYNKFFQTSPKALITQKTNDNLKDEFCKLNNIKLIRLNKVEEFDTHAELRIS
jgi:hypothetical protein